MASDSTRLSLDLFQSQAEQDLLQLILNDEAPYPWNPAETGAEAYFAEVEQEMASEWSTEELAVKGQALAVQIEQMWATLPADGVDSSLRSDLLHRFAAQVPHQLLENIMQRAQQALTTNLSMAERMVQCVQDLVPDWEKEDLLVLSRPFAYAMRDHKTADLDSASQVTCWTNLSSIEQARLSLAIAHYAITKLPTTDAHQ